MIKCGHNQARASFIKLQSHCLPEHRLPLMHEHWSCKVEPSSRDVTVHCFCTFVHRHDWVTITTITDHVWWPFFFITVLPLTFEVIVLAKLAAAMDYMCTIAVDSSSWFPFTHRHTQSSHRHNRSPSQHSRPTCVCVGVSYFQRLVDWRMYRFSWPAQSHQDCWETDRTPWTPQTLFPDTRTHTHTCTHAHAHTHTHAHAHAHTHTNTHTITKQPSTGNNQLSDHHSHVIAVQYPIGKFRLGVPNM